MDKEQLEKAREQLIEKLIAADERIDELEQELEQVRGEAKLSWNEAVTKGKRIAELGKQLGEYADSIVAENKKVRELEGQLSERELRISCLVHHANSLDTIMDMLRDAGIEDVKHTAWAVESIIEQRDKAEVKLSEAQLPKWISVDKRLPDQDQQVITLEGEQYPPCNEDLGGATFIDGKFWYDLPSADHPLSVDNVTYWMPLPEPPNA